MLGTNLCAEAHPCFTSCCLWRIFILLRFALFCCCWFLFCFVFFFHEIFWDKWIKEWDHKIPPDKILSALFACFSWRLCSQEDRKSHRPASHICLDSKGGFWSHTTLYLLCKTKLFCELSETLICPWQYFKVFQWIFSLTVFAGCQLCHLGVSLRQLQLERSPKQEKCCYLFNLALTFNHK